VLEIAWLKAAIAEVADRHPVLRARFEKDEQGAWVEMRCDASRPVLEHMRLEPGSEDDGMRELESQLSRVAGRPLPIDRGPSARLVIVRTPNERCTLLVAAFHHAIFDDRSVTLFARDLAAAYNAALGDRPAVRRSPAASYASYVDWQRARPLSDESADLDYWQTVLAGLPRTGLLADRAARASAENGVWRRSLGASQADNLRRQAARLQATPFIIIAAAFAVTLARFADDRDVAFALPVSTRPGREYAETMGVFVNTVIIRIRVDPLARFRDVVSDMRRAVADALEHRHAPFQRVVQRLRPERDGTDNPLVDVSLALDDASQTPLTLRGAPGEPLRCAPGATKYRISATTVASRGVIELAVDYRAVEYGNATIVSFGTCWFNVLIAGAEQVEVPVGQASPISGDCHQALMANRKRTTHQEVKTNTLAAGFERVAATYGGSVAIDDGIAALTYAELDKQSRVICSELECAGHRPSTAVVFMAPRSAQALVWLLGATRAGLTCVPVERDLRADQLARVVRETQASAIATAAAWQQTEVAVPTVVIDRDITGERNGAPSKRGPAPETAAYILYTSGSTGPAKAVMTTHSVAVRHMTVARTLFDVGPTDRVLQFADFSFDAAIEQIWTTWLAGATLCVRRNETWTAADFFRRCTEFGVTVAGLPTSYWGHLVSQGLDDASVPTLRRVVVGGEAMRADLAARWLSKHPTTKLVNAYGPTEAAITATWFEASPTACHEAARPHLPIGRALPGRIPYILDDSGAPVPPGAVGELYLGGDLLAAGYLGLGTGSTHGFLADPFAGGGARMFRTRDVVRAGPDGVLEYLGRKDRQVKLLGRRLEPAQVEAAMEASSGVMEAVVLPSVDHGTVTGLTGYYTAPNGRSATSSATLRDELGVLLPKWMVPRTLNPVDRIPRTAGGKVDTAALPSVTRQTAAAPTEPRPQSLTAAEEVVLDAWRSVLGSTEIGIYDNFFALGGHSLLAASITAHIGRATGVDLPLRAMFEAPTVVSLGERLEDALLAEDATVDSSRGDATPSPDGMP
jgi:amino acid adenylation domain-containing protein